MDDPGFEKNLAKFMEKVRAAKTPDDLNEEMARMLREGGFEVEYTANGTPMAKLPDHVREAAIKASRNFQNSLLAAGSASKWEVMEVRSAKKIGERHWEVSRGPVIGMIILPHFSELSSLPGALIDEGLIGNEHYNAEPVATKLGIVIVEPSERRPIRLLSRICNTKGAT